MSFYRSSASFRSIFLAFTLLDTGASVEGFKIAKHTERIMYSESKEKPN